MTTYDKIAKLISEKPDPGGEVVKLLLAIEKTGIPMLVVQAVNTEGNPVIHVSVFSNKMTDFPLETEELYVKWVCDYAKELKGV